MIEVSRADIYDIAERLGKFPGEVEASCSWADIHRMQERHKAREKERDWKDNLRAATQARCVQQAMAKQSGDDRERVKQIAAVMFRAQYPEPTQTKGGMTVVTFAQLEAKQASVESQNRAAVGAIMQSNGGK